MAAGRPEGAGHPAFGDWAPVLLENGYAPLPILRGQKRPAVSRWSQVTIDEEQVLHWASHHPDCGIGLRTGELVAIDIDILDPDAAHAVLALAFERFGATLMRVGRWPKRLLLYRAEVPFSKMKVGKVEILGAGQQLVAFGLHPDTGAAYHWPLGETPLEVSLADLPEITEAGAQGFLAEAGALQAGDAIERPVPQREAPGAGTSPVRDPCGRVADGRDGWLSTVAFHAVHDALEAGGRPDPEGLAAQVWDRFRETADLERPRKDGRRGYDLPDAQAKVRDKLRLHLQGSLPARQVPQAPPVALPDACDVAQARRQLQEALQGFCDRAATWFESPDAQTLFPPRLGLRATVGLGKSAASRRALAALQVRLRSAGLPHRILVLTPSHALAEETCAAWRAEGVKAEVLRGYERKDPVCGAPMCRDLEAVRIALEAGEPVPITCCRRGKQQLCRHFHGCLKQENMRSVGTADMVVAPYDLLFLGAGTGISDSELAVVVVDEACWPRAVESDPLSLSDLRQVVDTCFDATRVDQDDQALKPHLDRAMSVLADQQAGPVQGRALVAAGLTGAGLSEAARVLLDQEDATGLMPGSGAGVRQRAAAIARRKAMARSAHRLFHHLAGLVEASHEVSADVVLGLPDPETGNRSVRVGYRRRISEQFVGVPLLHLDATLRPGIVAQVLPGLVTETIEAAAPHMHLTLVQGRFSKSALCPPEDASDDVRRAAARRVTDLVTHVRWLSGRVAPGRTLVITYKAIETAFAGIGTVEVAHFNAVAGLDCYGDVAQLIVIGRPLPDDAHLAHLAGTLFEGPVRGSYRRAHACVLMRSGTRHVVSVVRHEDPMAEELRAAICDDEVIQAIGRGRGVNRTAGTPLDVHVLADVALPLVHDRVTHWEIEQPDILQRMVLAGVAVDSPADAAVLHPGDFTNAEQAKKALSGVFKGNLLIYSYKGFSLKSARYKRAGRGRGWQRAYWLDQDAAAVRAQLEAQLGGLSGWEP